MILRSPHPYKAIYIHAVGVVLFLAAFSECCSQTTDSFNRVRTLRVNDPFPSSSFLSTDDGKGYFPLIVNGVPAKILVSNTDHPGVVRIAESFRRDLGYVSGSEPSLTTTDRYEGKDNVVIVGTVGKSALIDALVRERKVDLSLLTGSREKFAIVAVKNPWKGVKSALVIGGSDKRGTIYGMFELSRRMGVSPWYWWADAPVKSRRNVYVKPGTHTMGEPAVKYRGIFINDEEPALGSWTREKFGGFNHHFYERVYELILRLKGNYLWPAMWGKSLWDDDSLSADLADEMGIVLATSHHEPMMRAHVEWSRHGRGPWDYSKNPEVLQQFWREGLERTKHHEKVVTLAMRGDGDEAMSESTNIGLLERIVNDQRRIIEEVTGKPAEETPQVWALYKEVQDYYDKGMRVPDDVTLLLCDDNWGQVRILPQVNAKPRKGGYGMYYHFDFVGGPRSYKWLNTVQIERIFEQMRLTYEYGVREIWLTNVGDLKPMDLPISFFLDYAWNPRGIAAKDLPHYYTRWAEEQFGGQYGKEIGEVLALYTKYNARRKPELLEPNTYSLTNFGEADGVVEAYKALALKARSIAEKLPEEAHVAFYQLVLYPVEACANLNEMYVAAAKNRLYRSQMRASANRYADLTRDLFFRDEQMTKDHHKLADGKWNHIVNQTHIGHDSWRDPVVNKMPEVSYIQVPPNPGLGYAVEGGHSDAFPVFDRLNDQNYFVEVFNTGSAPLSYTIEANADWIRLSSKNDTVKFEEKVYVSIDWPRVPDGVKEGTVNLSGAGRNVTLKVPVRTRLPASASGFIANNGVISIEAVNFHLARGTEKISWEAIPNLGRNAAAITPVPVTAGKQTPGEKSPYLEYKVFVLDSGLYEIEALFSPTLNFQKDEGLLYGFSVDNGKILTRNLHEEAKAADWTYPDWWNNAVTDNIMKQKVAEVDLPAGVHSIRYWMVDPGLVLQKIIIRKKGIDAASYMGPPESRVMRKP